MIQLHQSLINLRAYLPCVLVLFLFTAISIAPLTSEILNHGRSMLLLMTVYYWALFRPRFLNIFSLFILGIVFDSFAALPLGFSSLVFIATHLMTQHQHALLLRQPFWGIWAVFAGLVCVVSAVSYATHLVLAFQFSAVTPYILDVIVSIALFPLVVLLLKITNPPIDSYTLL